MKHHLDTCVTINNYLHDGCCVQDVNKNVIKDGHKHNYSSINKMIHEYEKKGLLSKHIENDKRTKILKLNKTFYDFKKMCETLHELKIIK